MADEAPQSAQAATLEAQATVVDATSAVATQAAVAANAALHHAEHVAALSQEQAAGAVAEIRADTVEAIAEQHENIATIESETAWMRQRLTEQGESLSSLSQMMQQTRQETAAALTAIAERLTPPPPATEAAQEPEQSRQSAEGDAQREAENQPVPGRQKPRHRWI